MTAGEYRDSKRRWLIAGTASLLLHASLLLWWRGVDLAPGDGGEVGGGSRALNGGFAPGSVVEVQIDVDAPVAAGTTVPAKDVTTQDALPVEPAAPTAAPDSTTGGSEAGAPSGNATGQAGTGSGSGTGTGGAADGLGVGARTGAAGSGTVKSAVVPPRPIEITWPDTRRLSHCVGLRVDVRIRVDAQGRVESVEPGSTGVPDDCMRAALDTARRIRFTPGTVGGEPATLWSLVTIDFEKKK